MLPSDSSLLGKQGPANILWRAICCGESKDLVEEVVNLGSHGNGVDRLTSGEEGSLLRRGEEPGA